MMRASLLAAAQMKLTDSQRRMLLVLLALQDEDGRARVTMTDLRALSTLTVRSTRSTLIALRRKGLVERAGPGLLQITPSGTWPVKQDVVYEGQAAGDAETSPSAMRLFYLLVEHRADRGASPPLRGSALAQRWHVTLHRLVLRRGLRYWQSLFDYLKDSPFESALLLGSDADLQLAARHNIIARAVRARRGH